MKKNSAQFRGMGLAIAAMGTAALLTFKKMVKQYVEVGDMIHKMALRTGFAAETLSELAYAADISGADLTMLEKGVKKMSKTIVDASYGLETYLRVFRSLGLDIEDLLALSPEEQFLKIGAAIAEMENDTLRTAAAVDVFGRSGTMLMPFFKEGAEGIAKLRKEAHTLGIIFDEEAAAKAAKLKDAQTALSGSVKGLSFAILTDLIPVMTEVTKGFTDFFVTSREDAGNWTNAILGFFKIVAKGVEALALAWHGMQVIVFKGAEFIVKAIKFQIDAITAPLKLLAKLPGVLGAPARAMLKEVAEHTADLTAISEGYNKAAEEQIDIITDIIVKYDAFVATLANIKTGFNAATEAQKSFSTAITETALPPARDMTGVLEGIQGQLISTGAAFVTGGKMTEGAMAKQEAALMSVASAYQGGLPGIMGAIKMVTIGEFLKSLATSALPFLAKLAMAGVVVGMISAIFAGFMKAVSPKGFATGGRIGKDEPGIIGEEGPELFMPGTAGTIVPLRERAGLGALRPIYLTIAPSYQISAIDEIGVDEFMRLRGLPAIVEAIKVGILKPELQDALRIK